MTLGTGSRVILTRADSIKHFRTANMPITGTIVDERHGGYLERNFLICFDDGREGWYARHEFKGTWVGKIGG